MKRFALVVAVALAALSMAGCRKHVRVMVPNTDEGNACRRDCMQVYESCMGARGGGAHVCKNRENECLRTCPGAVY